MESSQQTLAVCRFAHVSEAQWRMDAAENAMPLTDIPLPKRATVGAAGYDFVCTKETTVEVGQAVLIPTGIRAEIAQGWVLMLFPRSSLGFKHRLMLCNTVGIIDSDYYHAANEGHIMVKVFNGGDHAVKLDAGERFCQGVLLPYGVAAEDSAEGVRVGGFGSTGTR